MKFCQLRNPLIICKTGTPCAGSWDDRGESSQILPCRCTLCLWGSAEPGKCGCLVLVPKGHRAPAWLQEPQQVTHLRQGVGWRAAGRGVAQVRAHLSLVLVLDIRSQCCHRTPTVSSCRGHQQEQPEGWLASREKGRKTVW